MTVRNKTKLTVFGGMLHAHLAGTKLKFRHFRDGVELPPILQDDHYDFDYQEYRLRKEMIIELVRITTNLQIYF